MNGSSQNFFLSFLSSRQMVLFQFHNTFQTFPNVGFSSTVLEKRIFRKVNKKLTHIFFLEDMFIRFTSKGHLIIFSLVFSVKGKEIVQVFSPHLKLTISWNPWGSFVSFSQWISIKQNNNTFFVKLIIHSRLNRSNFFKGLVLFWIMHPIYYSWVRYPKEIPSLTYSLSLF